jgi:hypothetical protein
LRNFGGLALISFGQNDFVYVVYEKIEELVCILLHVIIELLLFLPQPCDEFFGRNRAHLLLLRCYGIESVQIERYCVHNHHTFKWKTMMSLQISQASQQCLLVSLVLHLVFEHLVSEWLAEIERL